MIEVHCLLGRQLESLELVETCRVLEKYGASILILKIEAIFSSKALLSTRLHGLISHKKLCKVTEVRTSNFAWLYPLTGQT